MPDRAAFATQFRKRLLQYIEYSVEADVRRLGTMIAGDGAFLDELEGFLPSFIGAEAWMQGVRSFAAHANPVSYLMKVDWFGEKIVAVSLYCRFIENLDASGVSRALASSAPLAWRGPSLEKVGNTLGSVWPHGIGFRITSEGRCHSAIYNRISKASMDFQLDSLPRILEVCGFPSSLERQIRRDMAFICRPGPVGVVAIDSGNDGQASALKLDIDSVPLSWALRFVGERGAPDTRIREIEQLALSLSVRNAGYLGLKYSASGFEGWKFYMPVQPRLKQAALAPYLDVNKWIVKN